MKTDTYPNLYSKDSLGKIRVWRIEQSGDKYRTVSGSQDGEKVTTDWTTALPKNAGKSNETSGIEQASLEIEAKYTKQRKTGYFDSVNDVDDAPFEPMLAKNYKDYQDEIDFTQDTWLIQNKYNGLRLIACKSGLFTRKNELFVSIPHVEESLKPFFEKYPNAVLDGEVFNEDYRQSLNEIVKLARKTKHITSDDLKRSRELIRFYVYDGFGFDGLGQNAPYIERKNWIDANVINKYSFVEMVPTLHIKDADFLTKQYNKFVEAGHEGAILRKAYSPYQNKRSKFLLKYKPVDDAEFEILDIKEGNGNWQNRAKIISLKDPKTGRLFDATFKGNFEDAEECLRNKKTWIGKTVTIYYNGLTGLGCPQFAQFDYKNSLKD